MKLAETDCDVIVRRGALLLDPTRPGPR